MSQKLSDIFSFDHFFHSKLFGEGPLWAPLERLIDYLHSCELGQIEGKIAPNVTLINESEIRVHKGAIIESGVYIEGPCIIGPHVHIRHGAYIRGGAIFGEGALVGHCTEVKHAIFLNGAKAPHFNYVGDTILGADANMGAGSITANVRLDRGNVRVQGQETPLSKLGALVGDQSMIGCNAVLNPGTVLNRGSHVGPCEAVKGVI